MRSLDLHELFTYNPDTGDLTWKVRPRGHFNSDKDWKRWNTRYAGSVAGSLNTGRYVQVLVNKQPRLAHRIIWEMLHGEIPIGHEVDHINGMTNDNRSCNLRGATRGENCRNRKINKNNRLGVKGVHYSPNDEKYIAQIRFEGKTHYLGLFTTKGLAAVAYAKASMRYHGQFARLS